MNTITHFLTGYLVARKLHYKEDRMENFFVACCAIIPDIDSFINHFIPFEHGVWTHTYAFGMLFILGFMLISYPFLKPLLHKSGTSFGRLLLLGFLGLTSHFLLDCFTWHPGPCSSWLNPALIPEYCSCPGSECFAPDDRHHMFFWPIWLFPPHINTLFPYAWVTYEVRVWGEVIYTTIIGVYLVWRLWGKKDKIFHIFLPNYWWKAAFSKEEGEKKAPNSKIHLKIIIWYIGIVLILFPPMILYV